MIFRTAGCAEYDHPEVTVLFNGPPVSDRAPNVLLAHLCDAVAGGQRLQPGDPVRFGYRTLRVISRADGTLGLQERVGDEQWEEHVDQAVNDLWYQQQVAAKFGVAVDSSVSDDDFTIVQPCSRDAAVMILNRVEADDELGYEWLVRCGDDHEHDEWTLTKLFHVTETLPHVAQFLALPTGFGVGVRSVFHDGGVVADVFHDDSMLTTDGGVHFGPESPAATGDGWYRTAFDARFGHPDVVIRLTEAPVPGMGDALAQWLLDYLRDAVADGSRFLSGQTIQVGWRTLRIVERPDGLGLLERVGGEWEEHVEQTLRDLWFQKEVAASVGVADRLTFPADGQQAAVTPCALAAPATVRLSRSVVVDPAASGWSVRCVEDHDHGEAVPRPLTDVVDALPFATQFLALPVGSTVVVDAPEITATGRIGVRIEVDGRPAAPQPGSYLEALAAGSG